MKKANEPHELDRVVLTEHIPNVGLVPGDVGTIVLVHRDGAGFEVEFTALNGETLAVTTLLAKQVRPVRSGELTHARSLAA